MKHLALILFLASALSAQIFYPPGSVRRYAGTPTAGDCTASAVGRRAVDYSAIPSDHYKCSQTSSGVYEWEAEGTGGGGSGDITGVTAGTGLTGGGTSGGVTLAIDSSVVTGAASLTTGGRMVGVSSAGVVTEYSDFARSAAGRYTIYDSGGSGVTTLTVRAGAGQSSTALQAWVGSDGSTGPVSITPQAGGNGIQILGVGASVNGVRLGPGSQRFGSNGVIGWANGTENDGLSAGLKFSSANNLGITNGSSTTYWTLGAGGILAGTDNTYPIGGASSGRPSAIYSAGVMRSGTAVVDSLGYFQWTARSIMYSDANGSIRLTNAAANDFGLLQFGGTTSSFPALKRSTTELQAKLADDSAFTKIRSSGVIVDGATSTDCLLAGGTTGACGSGGSGTFQSLITDLEVTRTSGTVLTFAPGMCWDTAKSGTLTATISGGSGNGSWVAYCNDAGAIVVLHSTSAGLTVSGSGVLETQVTTPAIPEGAQPIAEGTISSGNWATSPTDLRTWSFGNRHISGTGMNVACATGVCTHNVDTAVVQTKTDTATTTGAVDYSGATATKPMKTGTATPGTCAEGEFFFETDANTTWACTATNTWTALGGGSSVTKVGVTFQKSPVWCDSGNGANPALEGDIQQEGGAAGAPTASCVGQVVGGLRFSNTTANPIIMTHQLPAGWSSGDGLALELLAWEGTGSGDVRFNAETKCVAAGEDMTGTSSYNTAQTSNTSTFAGGNLMRSLTWSSLTTTGCAAGELLRIRITRDNTVGGNLAATAQINHFVLKYKVTLE